jgi:hypothetical protein
MVGDDKLVEDLDRSVLEGNGQFLLEGFQIIDESIREFRPFNIGSTELRLRRENENYMPLSMFGDAMSKVAYFILTIVNNKGGIVTTDIKKSFGCYCLSFVSASMFKYLRQLIATR